MVENTEMAAGLWNFGLWFVLPIVLIYALGVWLGFNRTIVVYRNYNDVMVVGLLFVVPAMAVSAAVFLGANEKNPEIGFALLAVTLALEGLVLLFVLIRTWRDNPNPLKMLLALYVKIPTGVLFLSAVFDAFNGRKARDRRRSLLRAVLLAPLIHGLVNDRKAGRLPGLSRRSVTH